MSIECVWAGKLDKSEKEVKFSSNRGEGMSHSILLKQVLLGPLEGSFDETNVIEFETLGYMEKKIKSLLCCLKATKEKPFDNLSLDILFKEEVTFRLVKGSGPVTLVAQQMVECLQDDSEDEEGMVEDEEDLDEEEDLDSKVLSDKENLKSIKRKIERQNDQPKKMAKMEQKHQETSSEEEEKEEPAQTKKETKVSKRGKKK